MSKKTPSKKRSFQEAVNHMCSVMETLGFDMTDENFNGTPERFVRYLQEYLQPVDVAKVLKANFSNVHQEQGYKGMIVQANIPFRTICPHHLLPVTGRAWVGYIPSEKVVGISKLTRLVQTLGHQQPWLQETITDVIADSLQNNLRARGVAVVIEADHGCMTGRGVRVHDVPTTTSTVRGLMRDVAEAREEFFEILQLASRANR